MTEKPKKLVPVHIPVELKNEIKAVAARAGRGLAEYVHALVLDGLEYRRIRGKNEEEALAHGD